MAQSKRSIGRRSKLVTRRGRNKRKAERGVLIESYLTKTGKAIIGISKLTKKARRQLTEQLSKNRYRKQPLLNLQ